MDRVRSAVTSLAFFSEFYARLLQACTCRRVLKRFLLETWGISICKNPLNVDDGMHLPRKYSNLALKDET